MFRKIYVDLIKRALARRRFRWTASLGYRFAAVHLSKWRKQPLCGPILGSLVTNYRCNLSCRMCDLPARHRMGERKEADTGEMREILGQMKAIGVLGVGFTGGEPLLRGDIFELIAHARALGMITHLNTNGILLDDARVEEIFTAGTDSLNISFDGASAEVHDAIRGTPGAFAGAAEGLERVLSLRRRRPGGPRVKIVCVVQEANVQEIEALVERGLCWEVDAVEFIPEQRFSVKAAAGARSDALLALEETSALIARLKKAGAPIENSWGMLKLFGPSFRAEPSPLPCYADYASICVDCYGLVYPCIPWMNWDEPVGDLRENDIAALWKSPGHRRHRDRIGACRRCVLNCQAELNLLLRVRG